MEVISQRHSYFCKFWHNTVGYKKWRHVSPCVTRIAHESSSTNSEYWSEQSRDYLQQLDPGAEQQASSSGGGISRTIFTLGFSSSSELPQLWAWPCSCPSSWDATWWSGPCSWPWLWPWSWLVSAILPWDPQHPSCLVAASISFYSCCDCCSVCERLLLKVESFQRFDAPHFWSLMVRARLYKKSQQSNTDCSSYSTLHVRCFLISHQ